MDSESRRALGLELGDTIEIVGKRTVVAKVFKGDQTDEGRGLLLIDGLTRTNAGVSVDESVLDAGGNLSMDAFRPIAFEPAGSGYHVLGGKVGSAFQDGLRLK